MHAIHYHRAKTARATILKFCDRLVHLLNAKIETLFLKIVPLKLVQSCDSAQVRKFSYFGLWTQNEDFSYVMMDDFKNLCFDLSA